MRDPHLDPNRFKHRITWQTGQYHGSPVCTGHCLMFVTWHGAGHTFSPSSIPAWANMATMKSLGIRAIVAFSAVRSLCEQIQQWQQWHVEVGGWTFGYLNYGRVDRSVNLQLDWLWCLSIFRHPILCLFLLVAATWPAHSQRLGVPWNATHP